MDRLYPSMVRMNSTYIISIVFYSQISNTYIVPTRTVRNNTRTHTGRSLVFGALVCWRIPDVPSLQHGWLSQLARHFDSLKINEFRWAARPRGRLVRHSQIQGLRGQFAAHVLGFPSLHESPPRKFHRLARIVVSFRTSGAYNANLPVKIYTPPTGRQTTTTNSLTGKVTTTTNHTPYTPRVRMEKSHYTLLAHKKDWDNWLRAFNGQAKVHGLQNLLAKAYIPRTAEHLKVVNLPWLTTG